MQVKRKQRARFSIPRGIIYHKVATDASSLFLSFFSSINDSNKVKQFEQKFANYIGTKYAVAMPFARTAIYYVLKRLELPKGSEIIMPPITIKGILDVVLDLGLKPVFVDISLETLCFYPEKLDEAINSNTRAIIITYLFGIVPDLDEMMRICQRENILVIEDFSQCLNGKFKNKKVGCFGDVGIYSASSIKTLDTYGGGLLVCDDKQLHHDLKQIQSDQYKASRKHLIQKVTTDFIRNIATSRVLFHLFVFPLLKIISILKPGSVMKHTGGREQKMIQLLPKIWFEKYTSFQAKIGLMLLNTVESSDLERKKNVEYLKSNINDLSFPADTPNSENIYWQFVAFFDKPIEVQAIMHKMGIDTSTTSLEIISSLNEYPYKAVTPNADYLYNHGLFIPSYPGLSSEDLQYIADVVNEAISQTH